MTVEILYSEVCNLFGDIGNIRYLEKSLPDSEFIYTRLGEKPYFCRKQGKFNISRLNE